MRERSEGRDHGELAGERREEIGASRVNSDVLDVHAGDVRRCCSCTQCARSPGQLYAPTRSSRVPGDSYSRLRRRAGACEIAAADAVLRG